MRELCGYIGFRSPTSLHSNRHVLELNIAVHPAYQRQGIGHKLIDAVKDMARAEGISKLRYAGAVQQSWRIRFYRNCGFQEEGRLIQEFYVDGRYVDDILMSLLLIMMDHIMISLLIRLPSGREMKVIGLNSPAACRAVSTC